MAIKTKPTEISLRDLIIRKMREEGRDTTFLSFLTTYVEDWGTRRGFWMQLFIGVERRFPRNCTDVLLQNKVWK